MSRKGFIKIFANEDLSGNVCLIIIVKSTTVNGVWPPCSLLAAIVTHVLNRVNCVMSYYFIVSPHNLVFVECRVIRRNEGHWGKQPEDTT